jgi:hypothetical protein
MKKNEAIEAGKTDGRETFELMHRTGMLAIRADVDFDFVREIAAGKALEAVTRIPGRSADAYQEPFVTAFVSAAREVHGNLPEVKAERRLRWLQRHVDERIKGAQEAVAAFAKRLADNPLNAFEWGTDAVKDAAYLHVYTQLQQLMTEKGIDAVVEVARVEALRYVRYGHHSTSPMSNLAAEFKAAAFAEFADRDVRW